MSDIDTNTNTQTTETDTNTGTNTSVGTQAPTNTVAPVDYNFKVMEGVEETPEIKAIFESVKGSLKDTGLPMDKAQALVDGLFNTLVEMDNNENKQAQTKFEEGKQALIKEWGDKYEATLDKCNDVILKADGGKRNGDFEMAIRESGINRDPRFVKGLAAIASRFSEDSFVVNNGAGLNKESIQDEIKALMQNPSYMNENAIDHKDIVAKVWAKRQQLV